MSFHPSAERATRYKVSSNRNAFRSLRRHPFSNIRRIVGDTLDIRLIKASCVTWVNLDLVGFNEKSCRMNSPYKSSTSSSIAAIFCAMSISDFRKRL